MLRKNILLLNKSKLNNFKAILTIVSTNNKVDGVLTNYNIPNGNYYLGVAVNGKEVFNNKIQISNNAISFNLPNVNNSDKVDVIVVTIENNEVKPIVWGTSFGEILNKNSLIQAFSNKLKNENRVCETENNSKSVYYSAQKENKLSEEEMFNTDITDEVEKTIENEINNEQTENNINILSTSQKQVKTAFEDENETFFDLLKDQIEDIFKNYPHDKDLSNVIPNSVWASVDFENNGKIYVIGLIYEDDKVKYICYGVPSNFGDLNNEEIKQYAQWLPLKNNNFEGYYIMYQDAISGEQIKVDSESAI